MWAERIVSLQRLRRELSRIPVDRWLTRGECERWRRIRAPQRAWQWLAGRWLAKQLLLDEVVDRKLSTLDLQIESRDARDRGTRPRVFCRGQLQPWQVSISHSWGTVYVAVALGGRARIGVDVTSRRSLSPAFARFWLTPAEREWCGESAELACCLWSLKESFYKALGEGRRFLPRQLDMASTLSLQEVLPDPLVRRRSWHLPHHAADTVLCRCRSGEVTSLVWVRDHARQAQDAYS